MSLTRDYRKVTLRFYDPDLIAWLDSLPTAYGTKSQAITAALKIGTGLGADKPANQNPNPVGTEDHFIRSAGAQKVRGGGSSLINQSI